MTSNVCSISLGVVDIPRVRSICAAKRVIRKILPKINLTETGGGVGPRPSVVMIKRDAAPGQAETLGYGRCRYVFVMFNRSFATLPTATLCAVTIYHCTILETIVTVYISASILTVYRTVSLCRR